MFGSAKRRAIAAGRCARMAERSREATPVRDPVESTVQIREQPRVTDEGPAAAREVGPHRRSRRALEDEIGAVNADDVRCGIAALADVAHDGDFAGGHVVLAVTTQDGTRIERLHVRVTTRASGSKSA